MVKKPCPCPGCHGALRDPKTVRSHREKQVVIEATHTTRIDQNQHQLGQEGAAVNSNSSQNRNERQDLSDQEDIASEDSDLQYQPKRRRLNESNEENSYNLDGELETRQSEHSDGHSVDSPDGRATTSFVDPFDNDNIEKSLSQLSIDPNINTQNLTEIRRPGYPPSPGSNKSTDSDSESELVATQASGPNIQSDSGSEDDEDFVAQTRTANLFRAPQPDPDDIVDDEEVPPDLSQSRIDHVRVTQLFIQEVRSATLENGKLDSATIERLRNPDDESVDISDPDLRFSLDVYMACMNASEATYNGVRQSLLRRFPGMDVLSHYRAKKLVSSLSGIVSIEDDMCINSCMAYTGPFSDLDTCPVCLESRYLPATAGQRARNRNIPQKKMCTIPIGPQIQALRRSVHNATAMTYRDKKTQEVLENLEEITSDLDTVYDDIFCGQDILNLTEELKLTSDDTTVIFSIDGAQLYQNKKSDTWIAIWIVTDYDPKTRYKSKHILPALIVPGPNKPKNVDSFLFRTFHHLSACQRENNGAGIHVFDARKKQVISSRIVPLFATADAVGLVELDGRVGHHGCHGCRKGCPMYGRHKPGSGHYFATHLRPNNYTVEECSHPDFNFASFTFQITPEQYERDLSTVTGSLDQTDYERNRKATGLSKPSILSGLRYSLPVPLCFTVDLMHLICLNLADLMVGLWRGSLKCETSDDKLTWDWVKLVGNTWQEHGKLVASTTKHFPAFFHRTPRNPAEKINSGYKATEYYLYLFGLGPGFFRAVLPKKYWKNFCKLVRGIHIIMQRHITGRQVQEAHSYLVQFVEEYEHLYYQRRVDRLHYTRPCIHSLLHTAPEVLRAGNGCLTDQYTMERAIGELGKGIRQPSNPFSNLAQSALRRAQINALKAICPELDRDLVQRFPRFSHNLGNGYVLLRPRERTAQQLQASELAVTREFCDKNKRQKWGRVHLPNEQVARSVFSEERRNSTDTRNSRNIKLKLDDEIHFAEVQFYFLDRSEDDPDVQAFAVISVYGPPNEEMLRESSHTLYACKYQGDTNLRCVPVSTILSVVSMQPLPRISKIGNAN